MFSISRQSLGSVSGGEVEVRKVGDKPGSSGAATSDADGVVYLATLASSTIYSWNVTEVNKPN